jgi:metal-sulfur cluster biosynthetic enzyme
MNDDILSVLKQIIDPELGLNVVDLGLVYRAERAANGIEVVMAMTSPACPLGEMIVDEARSALQERFPDVALVHVALVREPAWTPDRMTDEGRRQLGIR